ncbi:MAG: hypothetical protein N3E47_02510 [Candidatus Bathyarchaeota archaeon]|nr:hypothetical protein [Candidatus Bathyarchaeota archaeon]
MLVPNIRVESVREKNIGAIIDRINVLLNDVDVIYISSDDYLLSVALTLAGLRAGKKISYFSEDEIVELKI